MLFKFYVLMTIAKFVHRIQEKGSCPRGLQLCLAPYLHVSRCLRVAEIKEFEID